MAYANGKIPLSALTKMSTNLYARADAAASYERMAKEFNKVYGPMLMTDAYRSYELQVKIFTERYDIRWIGRGPYGDVRWWNGKRYVRMRNAAAAVPGTSNHGIGVAVDFASGINSSFSSPQHNWMKAHAGRFGWSNAAGRTINEPWHWEYNPVNDSLIGTGGSGAGVIAGPSAGAQIEEIVTDKPLPEVNENMFRIVVKNDANKWKDAGKVYAVQFGRGDQAFFRHISPAQNATLEQAGVELRPALSQYEKDLMRQTVLDFSQASVWKVQ